MALVVVFFCNKKQNKQTCKEWCQSNLPVFAFKLAA